MEIKQVALVIADISGYTQFIQANKTSILHAEEIISQLLEVVIEKATYPLVLNKLEGDAVLMYAEVGGDAVAASQDVIRQVQALR
jgi:class 3 adenylate cyclase